MKKDRGRQAVSVVRAPTTTTFVDIDPKIPVSWIKQCEARAHARIAQDFKKDKGLLDPPNIQPYDPREDDEIWHQLHDPKPAKPSITQHITRVLPVLDENTPTVAVPWYEREFYEDYTTQPMEPVLR